MRRLEADEKSLAIHARSEPAAGRVVRNHLQSLAAGRTGESICTFSRAVDCRGLDTWIVRAVYEEIQRDLSWACPELPVRWTDRLKEDLRIDSETLDEELVLDIAHRTGRDLGGSEKNPLFGKVETVRDLILFFHDQPKRIEQPAGAQLGLSG